MPSTDVLINDGTSDPENQQPKGYLEHEATLSSVLPTQAQLPTGRLCGSLSLVGADEDGNRIAKRLVCGREWCERCRDTSHNRRIARVLPHLMQILPMSYIIITFPLEVRPMMKDPHVLALIAKKTRRLLRRRGYRKVYTRWHFYGQNSERFHPHLNVLCDGEWLPPESLDALKTAIRRRLLKRSIADAIGKDLDINYAYCRTPKRIMHRIKYVTKATFLDYSWDDKLASWLYRFHNGCFSGTWNDPPRWRLTGKDKKYNALVSVATGNHPVSGKPITWHSKPIPWVFVNIQNAVDIGGGYYLLPR